ENNKTDKNRPDIGFNSEYNALHVFWKQRNVATENSPSDSEQHFDIARKSQLAKQLISLIAKQYKNNKLLNEKNTA
ncbi:MAG: hypothetical protein RQ982_08770, partial [Gammaproteobacteria bacterium]|nr:hypothetical protein [Gammaproteobacteria bacterium]